VEWAGINLYRCSLEFGRLHDLLQTTYEACPKHLIRVTGGRRRMEYDETGPILQVHPSTADGAIRSLGEIVRNENGA
jgi:hypothetical protein